MRAGAEKYGPYNWRTKKVSVMIYVDATLRHLMAFVDREECASDSRLPHIGHALACLGILADAIEGGHLHDDRPPIGPAWKLLKRYDRSTR
jgi:hypothetical protein